MFRGGNLFLQLIILSMDQFAAIFLTERIILDLQVADIAIISS